MQERLHQIYLITNSINNKKYVGQTYKDFGYLNRWKVHTQASINPRDRFHSAIKHYGKEAFIVELIEDDIPESLIDSREIYYIEYYNTYYLDNQGYNMTIGGQGVHGYVHTEQDRQKISEASKLFWGRLRQNPEKLEQRNKKISDKQKGQPKSEETKLKLSASRYDENGNSKFSGENNPFYNKKHTNESIALMRQNAHRKELDMLDKDTLEFIRHFESLTDAYRFLDENDITHSNTACIGRLSLCAQNPEKHVAYGYRWRFTESVSTIPAGSTEENLLPLEVPSHSKE